MVRPSVLGCSAVDPESVSVVHVLQQSHMPGGELCGEPGMPAEHDKER